MYKRQDTSSVHKQYITVYNCCQLLYTVYHKNFKLGYPHILIIEAIYTVDKTEDISLRFHLLQMVRENGKKIATTNQLKNG